MAPSKKAPTKSAGYPSTKPNKQTVASTLAVSRARFLRMPGSRYPAGLVDSMSQEDLDAALALQRRYDVEVASALFATAKKLGSPQRSVTTTSTETSLLAPVFHATNDLAPDVKRIFARTKKLRDEHELSRAATEELMKETHEVLNGEGSYAIFLGKKAWYAAHPECIPPAERAPMIDRTPGAKKRTVQASWEESAQESSSAKSAPNFEWEDGDADMNYDSDPSSRMSPAKQSTPSRNRMHSRPIPPNQDIWFHPIPSSSSTTCTAACFVDVSEAAPLSPVQSTPSFVDLADTDDSDLEDVTPVPTRINRANPAAPVTKPRAPPVA
mmetsp:Transcript_28879/g.41366  ORF Transcript_28879/g.41366 Transcript_28879/m.41366 type:complete len:326 (+) Transcript_28879:654-1631(+)